MSKTSAFPAHRHALQEQQPLQPCKGLWGLNALLQSTAGANFLYRTWTWILQHLPKHFTENSFKWFHLNFKKKSSSQHLTRRDTFMIQSWVCAISPDLQRLAAGGLPRNSEVLVLSEDQNVSWDIQGLQAWSQKNPVLNHTWPMLI